MSERTVTVAVMIEYRVEGPALAAEIGSTAVGIGIPSLPQFHVKGTICTPTAVDILKVSEP